MKNKTSLIICMILLVSIGFVNAGKENLGIFEQNETVRIVQTCDEASYITLSSVSYPNGSIAVSGINMASIGNGEFYYDFIDTNILGIYDVRGISDGCENTFIYYFEVSKTGKLTSPSQGMLSIGILISILFIMLFFGWLSFKFIDKNETFGFGLFFLVISLILSLYSLFLGYVLSRDYLFTSISDVQEKIFISGLFGLSAIMLIAFVFLIIAVVKQLKVKNIGKKYGEGYNQKSKTYDY
jgi:hypothetical protein